LRATRHTPQRMLSCGVIADHTDRPMSTITAEERRWRTRISEARCIVVKVGTRVLMGQTRGILPERVDSIAADVAALMKENRKVVVVSSGAIGCGMAALGMRRRPTSLPDLQMAAAVGQTYLMALYQEHFKRRRRIAAQILLTHDDLKNRRRHLNARNTLMSLLRRGIVPVINENDVVAVDEIKLGDNDFLAALVAMLVSADLMVLLTTANGVREPFGGQRRTRRIPVIHSITPELRKIIGRHDSHLSVGGMATKLEAASMAAAVGIPTVIADGRRAQMLRRVVAGEPVGTVVAARAAGRPLSARKQWIAFFHRPQGTVVIDSGACEALQRRGKSLLPIGIREVHGEFSAGSVVDIRDTAGRLVGRGLADYSSEQIRRIMGHPSSAIADILGSRDYDEVIHRDNMILFQPEEPKGG